MAHVEVVQGNGERSRILNVTDAVGPSWGMEEDVMLVKTLLEVPLMSWGGGGSGDSAHTHAWNA